MRLAADAREVIKPDLLNGKSAILRLHNQLGVDERAFRFEIDRLEHFTLHEFERKVDVAMRPAEEYADQRVVDVGVDCAARTLDRAVVAIAGDHVGAGDLHRANGAAEDVGVEWEVGVHVQHQILRGDGESCFERAAELPVFLVANHPYARILGRPARHEHRRRVGRGIVDDDDLVIVGVPRQRVDCDIDGTLDVLLLIEHRNDEGNGWAPHQGDCTTRMSCTAKMRGS